MPESQILNNEAKVAAPNNSKIIETVVDVGRPNELKIFNNKTSPIIRLRISSMIS